jgi:GTP-binding protein HflX
MTIGVVGYTNAGKSTLTNALTKKWVLAEDKLFATLGTSVWKMWLPT